MFIQRHHLAIDHSFVRHRHEGLRDARIAPAEVVVIPESAAAPFLGS